jgi:tetratricopeptide (TPR) repeat protein
LVAAELFARADRGGEAIELLRAGIDRLGPEHNVFSLYLVAAELLVKAERGGEAIELLQVGIEQLSPEHSVVALYQASAELLAKAERAAEAIELLEEGIDRLGPEHNVFSLYLVVAELLTKSERTAEALDLLKTGIGRVGPEHSVFSLYQIASELIARSGDYQQAIQLLVDGFKRIGTRNYGHRLAEGALLLAYAMRNKDLLEEFARQIPEKSLTTFARMLELALDGRWEEGVGISQALRRGGVTSATLLGQEAFFLLCLGRWREADDILSKIESRATDLNAWLRAVAHFIGGEPDRALYYMSICLGRPLTREEQVDPILWIRTWDDKASTHGFNPAFYFPILPTELTGTKDGLRRLLCGPPALAE